MHTVIIINICHTYIGMLSRIEEEKSSLSAEKDQLIRALENLQKSTAANRLVSTHQYIHIYCYSTNAFMKICYARIIL